QGHPQHPLPVYGPAAGTQGIDEQHRRHRDAVAVIGDRFARADSAEQPPGARELAQRVQRVEHIEDLVSAWHRSSITYLGTRVVYQREPTARISPRVRAPQERNGGCCEVALALLARWAMANASDRRSFPA